MIRRTFLQLLGLGAISAVAAPLLPKQDDGWYFSQRPKAPEIGEYLRLGKDGDVYIGGEFTNFGSGRSALYDFV